MHWKRPKKNKLPETEVLAVDCQQNYMIGLLFEDKDSCTGYICHSVDDEEIECVAYQEIAKSVKLHNVNQELPSKHQVVIGLLESGEAVIGHVYQDTETGLYMLRNDINDYVGVEQWYIPKKYNHTSKVMFIRYFTSLAATFFLGLMLQAVLQSYMDVVPHPLLLHSYDVLMYELEHLSKNTQLMADLKQYLKDSGEVDMIELSYDGRKYSESLNMDNLYVDNEGYWHYICEDGTTYIMSEQKSYRINPSKRRYCTLTECTIGFYNIKSPDEIFDARRINESSDTSSVAAFLFKG